MTTRKKYSQEFKLDAISLVLEQGYSRAEASRNLEINPNMLGRWIKEHQKDEGQAFRGNGKLRRCSIFCVRQVKGVCGRARSIIPAGGNPVPAR